MSNSARRKIVEQHEEIERLKEQRDAWKDAAEHHYGLLRVALYGDSAEDYPVTGALDAWAAGRYPALTPNAQADSRPD